jgi:hypothetical protein
LVFNSKTTLQQGPKDLVRDGQLSHQLLLGLGEGDLALFGVDLWTMLEIINGSSSKMVQTWWNMVSSEAILILANHDSNHDQVTVAAVGMI